jgi:5'(3')-deoxyribonucleotidase
VKLIVAGPPHSGKSVFISALTTAFRSGKVADGEHLYPLKFDATPDGETNFVKESYYNAKLVQRLRKKGQYNDKLRRYIQRCVTSSRHPLMLIDLGGKPHKGDIEMLRNATHAIILSGGELTGYLESDEENAARDAREVLAGAPEKDFKLSVQEWTQFFKDMDIQVIMELYSDYDAPDDYKMADGTLAIHHLDRDAFISRGNVQSGALDHRENIIQVARKIRSVLEECGEYNALVEVSKSKNRHWELDANGKISDPDTYDRPQQLGEKEVVIAGGYSGHVLAKTVIDELKNGKTVQYCDPKLGVNIPLVPLPLGAADRKYFDEPMYIGDFRGRHVYHIRTLLNHSQKILLPEDLEQMRVPKVPSGSVVKLSSTGSQWFGAIVTASYLEHCDAVGISLAVNGRDVEKVPATVLVCAWSGSGIEVCDVNSRLTVDSQGVIVDKPVVYIDMDGVLADFNAGVELLIGEHPEYADQYEGQYKNMPGLFEVLPEVEGAISSAKLVSENFNAYILTATPWHNETALQAKQDWIKQHFTDADGFNPFERKVITTHHKELLRGDILIDDSNTNGVYEFDGQHIWFGAHGARDWVEVLKTLGLDDLRAM